LGNFTSTQAFWKFPKFFVFEGGIFSKFWKFLKLLDIWGISQKLRHLGNFPDTQEFGKIPIYPGIWEIPQIPLDIRGWYIFKISEIFQMTGYLGSFPET